MALDEDLQKLMARETGRIVYKTDEIAEKLDELADICEYWKRQRERGRNPSAIRAALVMLSQEVATLVANA